MSQPKMYVGTSQVVFGADVPNSIYIPLTYQQSNVVAVGFLPYTNCSGISNWNEMFQMCVNLRHLELDNLNPSNAISLDNFVYQCPLLTDNSLSSILRFCARAVNVNDKDLTRLGFTTDQINNLPSMNNYSDAINAGWTIGGA